MRFEIRVLTQTEMIAIPVGRHGVVGLGPGRRRVERDNRGNEQRPDNEGMTSFGAEAVLVRRRVVLRSIEIFFFVSDNENLP